MPPAPYQPYQLVRITDGTTLPLSDSIVDAIGNTPMVELHRVVEKQSLTGRILAKCEYLNPGFSKKDRIALEMIREAGNCGLVRLL